MCCLKKKREKMERGRKQKAGWGCVTWARVCVQTRANKEVWALWLHDKMAVNEGDDLASLEAKTVNDGAIVELLRRRYNHHKIYVSWISSLLSLFGQPAFVPRSLPFCKFARSNRFCSAHGKTFVKSSFFADLRQRCIALSESFSTSTHLWAKGRLAIFRYWSLFTH